MSEIYRYVKHDYGFRKVRIDGVTGCQIERDSQDRWILYLLRNGVTNYFSGCREDAEIAGFFPTLEAAQSAMERIWAAMDLDAVVIE